MGPALLLDKSGIQSLPQRLLPTLWRHYFLVVPPILVLEICGDLLKTHQGGAKWMRMLSEKIGGSGFSLNMDHRDLRVASLLGKPVTMDGRPIVEAQEFDTSLGKASLVSQTDEHFQLLRWRFEKPSSLDEQAAREWRQAVSSVDLEKTKAHLKAANPDLPRVRSIAELGPAVDALLRVWDHRLMLEMCLEDAHLDEALRKEIRKRWEETKAPALWSFAPYAFFCFRIRMLFHVGLTNSLVSTRRSNTADLIYLYYAPFCKVLSSNDRMHEDLAPLVLRSDQDFIPTSSLRSDLEAIENFWEQLSLGQRRMWCIRPAVHI